MINRYLEAYSACIAYIIPRLDVMLVFFFFIRLRTYSENLYLVGTRY